VPDAGNTVGMRKGHENDPVGAGRPGPRFVTCLARTEDEVREAQRLRHRVFAEELGARLDSAAERLDRDRFDEYCEHLLVRSSDTGEVVGTYRILTAANARRAGGFYSEQEFDLGAIPSLPRVVEIGRACVHPDHRSGAVLALLWGALAQHFRLHGYEHVIGCASVPISGDPAPSASLLPSVTPVPVASEEPLAAVEAAVVETMPAEAAILDTPPEPQALEAISAAEAAAEPATASETPAESEAPAESAAAKSAEEKPGTKS